MRSEIKIIYLFLNEYPAACCGVRCLTEKWDPIDEELPLRLARILLALPSDQAIEALRDLWQFMREQYKSLIFLLAPFWLDLPSIACMINVVQIDQKIIQEDMTNLVPIRIHVRTSFGLNAVHQETACMHVSRAGFYEQELYRIILLSADYGFDAEGRFTRQIIKEINNRAGRINKSDNIIDNFIIKYAVKKPTFIILPFETDKETIKTLRKNFWPFIFIVLTGRNDTSDLELLGIKMINHSSRKARKTKYPNSIGMQ